MLQQFRALLLSPDRTNSHSRLSICASEGLGIVISIGLAMAITTLWLSAEQSPRFVGANANVNTSARTAAAAPPTVKIVPAPVVDTSAAFFIGTGDHSAGSWIAGGGATQAADQSPQR